MWFVCVSVCGVCIYCMSVLCVCDACIVCDVSVGGVCESECSVCV